MMSLILPSVRHPRPKLTFVSSVVGDYEKRLMRISKFALLNALYWWEVNPKTRLRYSLSERACEQKNTMWGAKQLGATQNETFRDFDSIPLAWEQDVSRLAIVATEEESQQQQHVCLKNPAIFVSKIKALILNGPCCPLVVWFVTRVKANSRDCLSLLFRESCYIHVSNESRYLVSSCVSSPVMIVTWFRYWTSSSLFWLLIWRNSYSRYLTCRGNIVILLAW
jgi:hypothetical protein